MLAEMDDKNEKVQLVLNGKNVLETLQEKGENINPKWVKFPIGFLLLSQNIQMVYDSVNTKILNNMLNKCINILILFTNS